MKMTQLYLCEEPYWSKYDQSDLYEHTIEINVISDGKATYIRVGDTSYACLVSYKQRSLLAHVLGSLSSMCPTRLDKNC